MTATQLMFPGISRCYDDDVRLADDIVSEAELGIFFNSALLIDFVLRDARLNATLMTRIGGLLGKPFELDPAKDTALGRKYADECENEWSTMFEHSSLVELMSWGLMQGVGLAQVLEDRDPWRLEVWHPFALVWDEFLRLYYVQSREDGRLYLHADPGGGYLDDKGTRWVLHLPFGYGNSGRRCYLRCLQRLTNERQFSHRDRARYSEIFGQPMRFGYAPANASKEERTEFKRRLRLGAEPVVVANRGVEGNQWGVELVEASGTSTDLFDRALTQLDKEIATLLLGQSQTTDGQSGLGSNDQAGEPVRLDIMKFDSDALTSTLRTQFLSPYWQFTYGNGDLAPWPCWHVDPPENRSEKALEFKTVIDGLVAAQAAGLPIDSREILEDYGIPLISEEEQAKIDAQKQKDALAVAKASPKTNGTSAKTETPIMTPAPTGQ